MQKRKVNSHKRLKTLKNSIMKLYIIATILRRKYVADILNIRKLPCIIKEMSDDEAIINMVDSNIQRENIFTKIIQTNKLKKEFLDY